MVFLNYKEHAGIKDIKIINKKIFNDFFYTPEFISEVRLLSSSDVQDVLVPMLPQEVAYLIGQHPID